MRDLLGGKGANVAEMTRVLGADRVPAGFTITTEACVAYMEAGQQEPDGLDEQVAEALARAAGARRQEARRRRGPAAGLGALRRPRVDAGDARHRPQPRAQRQVGRGPGQGHRATSASPGTPTGASCRCSATSSRGIDGEASSRRSSASRRDRGVEEDTDLDADALQGARRPFKALPSTDEDFPQDPQRAAPARRSAPSSTPGPATGRSSTGGINRIPDDWGTAVNVQQMVFGNKGDTSRLRRRLQPRRGHRRARALAATSCPTPRARTSSPARARRATSPRWRTGCPRPTSS